ncbi:MAG: hypothetical protein AAGI92_10835 [Pseudomonadota bacterium]
MASSSQPRQAVVVVHGIGEQKPGETLNGILGAIGDTGELGEARFVAVPDTRTGSRELYRVTTVGGDNLPRRTDFYEFYWADIMAGNTLDQVKSWVFGLLLRKRGDVPDHIKWAWLTLWAISISIVGLFVAAVATFFMGTELGRGGQIFLGVIVVGLPLIQVARSLLGMKANTRDLLYAFGLVALLASVLTAIVVFTGSFALFGNLSLYLMLAALGLAYIVRRLVVPFVGDVARYARVTPDTIEQRAKVIERGLALLRELHGKPKQPGIKYIDDSNMPAYDRVIIVAHSLGTMIAYDLIKHFWVERGPVRGGVRSAQALEGMERLGAKLKDLELVTNGDDLQTFRAEQRSICADLAQTDGAWRISDFISIGSPLTHAEFLLAQNAEELRGQVERGLLPQCPPQLFGDGALKENPITYRSSDGSIYARHSAPFSATRWVNIFDDPENGVLRGDVVSGRLRKLFKAGIVDVDVTINGKFGHNFTHTSYWKPTAKTLGVEAPEFFLEGISPSVENAHLQTLMAAMALREPVRPEELSA